MQLVPDLQRELVEYLSIKELENLLIGEYRDLDLEHKVISSDSWWKYIVKTKYDLTSKQYFTNVPLWKYVIPILTTSRMTSGNHHSLVLTSGVNYMPGEKILMDS
jgi:hypothetical protein